MIYILILILSHPILIKPTLLPMFVYPHPFVNKSDCEAQGAKELQHKSVVSAYCQEIEPVLIGKV